MFTKLKGEFLYIMTINIDIKKINFLSLFGGFSVLICAFLPYYKVIGLKISLLDIKPGILGIMHLSFGVIIIIINVFIVFCSLANHSSYNIYCCVLLGIIFILTITIPNNLMLNSLSSAFQNISATVDKNKVVNFASSIFHKQIGFYWFLASILFVLLNSIYEYIKFNHISNISIKINLYNVFIYILYLLLVFIVTLLVLYVGYGSWVKTSNGYQYRKGFFFPVKNCLYTIDGKQYFFDKNGIMQTGRQNINGTTYFFHEDGSLVDGWYKEDDNWRFCVNGKTIYGRWVNSENKITQGLKNLPVTDVSGVYYIDKNGYMVKDQTITIDGKKYKFDSNGYRITN